MSATAQSLQIQVGARRSARAEAALRWNVLSDISLDGGAPLGRPVLFDQMPGPVVAPQHLLNRKSTSKLGFRLRQFGCATATFGILVGLWLGTGALVSAHVTKLYPPVGAVSVHGGYRYVLQPGDTLWSIASAFEPSSDPRSLVATLSAELGNKTPQPGQQIVLPTP